MNAEEKIATTPAHATSQTSQGLANTEDTDYFVPLLGTEQFFSRTAMIFSEHASCFLTISFLSVGLRYLLTYISDVVNGPDLGANYNTDEPISLTSLDSAATSIMLFVEQAIFYLAVSLNDAAIIQAVAEVYSGEVSPPTTIASIGSAAYKLRQLLGSFLLVVLMMTIVLVFAIPLMVLAGGNSGISFFLVILLVSGIYYYIVLITYNTNPAIIVENSGAIGSIKRSMELAEGHMSEIFVVTFLFRLCTSLITVFVSSILTLAGDNAATSFFGPALLFCFSVVFASLSSILKSVVYFHIRVCKERLSQELLAAQMRGLPLDNQTYIELNEVKKESTDTVSPSRQQKQQQVV